MTTFIGFSQANFFNRANLDSKLSGLSSAALTSKRSLSESLMSYRHSLIRPLKNKQVPLFFDGGLRSWRLYSSSLQDTQWTR